MKKPEPEKNAECECCGERKPLLMPVADIPGFPVVVWTLACLACRLQHRYERGRSTQHGDCAEAWRYAARPQMRTAYWQWLSAELND